MSAPVQARPRRSLLRRVLRRIVQAGFVLALLAFAGLTVAYWMSSNVCDDPDRPAPAHPMKAIVYCDYGPPDVLEVEDVEKPVPGEGEVLVKVRAVAVNPLDWHYVRGTPYLMRMDAGLRKPKNVRLGVDFSGVVEAVGAGVTSFAPGDEVFGGRSGAFAEYVTVRADRAIARKPQNVTFEQAAAVPIAGLTALQALRDRAKVKPGQTVLVNGASGGVGTFTVQIAKSLGAEVTGVCSTRNVEMVRSLGADHVVDYTKEDFAKLGKRYDAVLDNVGNRDVSDIREVLAPGGTYVLIGGGGPDDHKVIGPLFRIVGMALRSKVSSEKLQFFISKMSADDLNALAEMMGSGRVTPVLDRTYPFEELPEALRYLERGRARGKVVVLLPS